MSWTKKVVSVLILLVGLVAFCGADAVEEDFAFDASEELEVEFEDKDGLAEIEDDKKLTAFAGRVFHLVMTTRKEFAGRTVKEFEAKKHGSKGLPSWLLFDKKSGIFWGLPLSQDVGEVHLTVSSVEDKNIFENLQIDVVEPSEQAPGIEKCSKEEDLTVLTLLLDRNIRAIKPKQRIIAVNNIAKFFGLPYSAFTLKPQVQKDDLTDSSVVLAGPGNLQARTSKFTSLIQVPVGCDGRLWLSTAPIVHQLKQQARDGTISEVLRLPLIGWRVRTETRSIARSKRDLVNEYDLGSGDYNDYYDGEYDYEEEEDKDLGYVDKVPPPLPPKVSVASTTTATIPTTQETTTTHPHRHHHGEINPSVAILRDHHHHTEETVPITMSVSSTTPMTSPAATTTTSSTTTSTTTTTTPAPTTAKSQTSKPVDDLENDYEESYDYGENYDDEEDGEEGPTESETIMPDLSGSGRRKETIPPVFEDTDFTTESTTVKQESVPTVPATSTTSTSTTTTRSTTSTTTTTTTTASTTTAVPSTSTTTTTSSTTRTTTPPPPPTISEGTTAASTEGTSFPIIVDNAPDLEFTTEIYKHPTASSESSSFTPFQSTSPSTTPMATHPSSTTPLASPTTTPAVVVTSPLVEPTEETEATVVRFTTVHQVPFTTPKAPTTVREVTESIEFHENFNPFIENRLKQQSVIAGKMFRFVIPKNTFKDMEDEYDLTYLLLDEYNRTIGNNTWLNFNPMRREIYGLPLERHVSKWVFWVKAFDRDGGSVQEKLLIQVQQHKLDLVVNHEFSLYIRIEKHQEFPHYVDWCLKVLRALGRIYNTNMTEITVRNINNTNEPVIFTWSNDSLPINICPKGEIEELYRKLTANDAGDPSRELNVALSPEMRVKKVLYKEMGVCEPQPQTPVTPPTNFSPILRNPVDHINATVGELLIYKVKDDTFYDPEDVDPRILNITLLTADRQPIPPDNWLQFDSKNREFYGIPRKSGRSEYQLVCVDTGGLPARDSLEVVVYPPNKKLYNVEFSMNITNVPHEVFVRSASLQRKFVEKLMKLFGDSTPSSIYLPPFRKSYDSTIVIWYNKSLPVSYCAHEEIDRLESILHGNNDNSISHRVYNEMETEFRVSTIKVALMHNCKPREKRPEIGITLDETATPESSGDEYLVTFIVPAVIISVMLILAAVAAIVLYRRRRMGKMNVEEDGRSSYGNKGIPVIFQEELEEKPEPGTKAPVILKDEKPPLAPPEYSKSGSVRLTDDSEPYQPPPPFARSQENGRQGRPKPTPTYRKPPPYVPP